MNELGHGYARPVEAKSAVWFQTLAVLNDAFGIWDNSNRRRFPGPLPSSIGRDEIPDLFFGSQDMAAAWKSDGTRSGLVFLTFQRKPLCVYVNRTLEMLLVPLDAPMFLTSKLCMVEGEMVMTSSPTVLDGELVKLRTTLPDGTCAERFVFETMDVPMMRGKPLREKHYAHRLAYGVEALAKWEDALQEMDNADGDASDDDASDDDVNMEADADDENGAESHSSHRRRDRALREQPVFDALQRQYTHPLIVRNKIGGGSSLLFFTHQHSCFDISIKPIFAVQDVRLIMEKLVPLLCYPVDGLCFTPMQMELQPFQCRAIKKWKWKNTVDFLWVRATPQILAQYPWSEELDPNYQRFATPHVPSSASASPTAASDEGNWFFLLVAGRYMDELSIFSCQRNPPNSPLADEDIDQCIVECHINEDTMQWMPEGVRGDRQAPNAHFTVGKTIGNIVENIRYEELTADSNTVFHSAYKSPMATPAQPVNATAPQVVVC